VLSRVTTSAVRGLLVALLVAMPSLILPGTSGDTAEIVTLVAIFAAVLTTIEYASSYPSVLEFRDAPPFNRIRYLSLFLSIMLISVLCRAEIYPSAFSTFVQAVGTLIGQIIDFPMSPVRLMVAFLGENADPEEIALVRNAAGISYFISLMSLLVFLIILRFAGWPRGIKGFNVWVNLPTFDPTAGADVVDRLRRDAWVNVAFGFMLPFLVPMAAKAGTALFDPVHFSSSHTMIWTMAAWAFLPASLFMRGIAMARVADMIAERRRRGQQSNPSLVTA
jgi:hypothetical protein